MLRYCTCSLSLKDVEDNIAFSKEEVQSPGEKQSIGRKITFTLKKPPPGEPNSFYFDGQIYMIEAKDDLYYEAVGIQFIKEK